MSIIDNLRSGDVSPETAKAAADEIERLYAEFRRDRRELISLARASIDADLAKMVDSLSEAAVSISFAVNEYAALEGDMPAAPGARLKAANESAAAGFNTVSDVRQRLMSLINTQ